MRATLSRYWWTAVLRGAAAIIFGVLALIWPGITLFVLVTLFGVYALAYGFIGLGTAARSGHGPRGWLVLEGMASILVGVLTFGWPGITALALLWVIAVWAMVTGALQIVAAARLLGEIEGDWLLAVSGVLSVLFAMVLAVWSVAGALVVVIMIGGYAILFGGALVGLGWRLHRIRRRPGIAPGAHRPATV